MKIENTRAQISKANDAMFQVIQQAQQTNQELSKKIIKLAIQQKTSQQKNQILEHLVDIYL